MNLKSLATLCGFFLLLLVFTSGCQKDEAASVSDSTTSLGWRDEVGECNTVDLTYPETIGVGEEFSILAEVTCGRIGLDRGYILVGGDTVRNDLTCSTPGIQWQELVLFACEQDDAEWTGSLSEPGDYVFRSRHNANEPTPCGNDDCDDFTGNNQCCFEIVVVADEVCYGPGETAWSDGSEYAEGGQWATFTAAGDFPVTLYAGQTLEAGTVSYDGTNITITLAAGWEFADVSENVKIQGYDVAPTEEPVPGQFENKTTAAIGSSPYSVAVDAANYYGVHVDLVPIVECE